MWTDPILNWSANCFIIDAPVENEIPKFTITDRKLYVPGFKRTINWNKYQSKVTVQEQNRYLDYLIDPNQSRKSLEILSSTSRNKGI